MGYELTLQGLLRKRGELAGDAATLRGQLDRRLTELDAIDRVIRVFNPEIDLEDLPEKAAPPALTGTRGEFQRFLLEELRRADKPLTTLDLAKRVLEQRGMDTKDRILAKLINERTGNSLGKMKRAGKVTSSRAGRGALLEWRLA